MKNYVFGAKVPTVNLNMAMDQLRLAHRYRNKLVELELMRRYDANVAIRRDFPRLLELDGIVANYNAQIDAIYAANRAENAKSRKRQKLPAEPQRQVKALRALLKPFWEEHKALRQAAYGNVRHKEILAAVKAEHPTWNQSEQKEESLRRQAAEGIDRGEYKHYMAAKKAYAESRIYWGTRLLVMKAAESMREGTPPGYTRYEGEGSLGVQIQGGVPFAALLAGEQANTARKLIQLHHRGGRQYDFWFRIGSGAKPTDPVWCVIPITLSPVPADDAIVKEIVVMRRVRGREFMVNGNRYVHGGQADWQVMLTCATTDVRSVRGGVLGIDVGWRRFENAGLRVAVGWGTDGARHELRLSQFDWDTLGKVRAMEGNQSDNFNVIQTELLAFRQSRLRAEIEIVSAQDDATHTVLAQQIAVALSVAAITNGEPLNEFERGLIVHDVEQAARQAAADAEVVPAIWFARRTKTLASWKSRPALAALVVEWRDKRFAGDEAIFSAAEEWRKRDSHLARYSNGMRRGFQERRKVQYRKWVHDMAAMYDTVALEDMDLREYCQLPAAEEDDEMSAKLRDTRGIANISKLREYLGEKMRVVEIDRAGTTEIHFGCGSVETIGKEVMHTCSQCGVTYDRDDNAAKNILQKGIEKLAQQAIDDAAAPPKERKPSRSERFAEERKRHGEAKRAAKEKEKEAQPPGEAPESEPPETA